MTNMLNGPGNNINFIFMRDQNSPPPQNNMLIGEKHQPYLHEGSTFATPMTNMLNGPGNNINFIFMRDQNQEGGTSTPGKRPTESSEHVKTTNHYGPMDHPRKLGDQVPPAVVINGGRRTSARPGGPGGRGLGRCLTVIMGRSWQNNGNLHHWI